MRSDFISRRFAPSSHAIVFCQCAEFVPELKSSNGKMATVSRLGASCAPVAQDRAHEGASQIRNKGRRNFRRKSVPIFDSLVQGGEYSDVYGISHPSTIAEPLAAIAMVDKCGRSDWKRPWHRRDLAGHTAEAGAALTQARVQRWDRLLGTKHALEQFALFQEPFAMRVALVEPVGQKPPAHLRQAPATAAVFEARHIVVAGIRPPDDRFGRQALRGRALA